MCRTLGQACETTKKDTYTHAPIREQATTYSHQTAADCARWPQSAVNNTQLCISDACMSHQSWSRSTTAKLPQQFMSPALQQVIASHVIASHTANNYSAFLVTNTRSTKSMVPMCANHHAGAAHRNIIFRACMLDLLCMHRATHPGTPQHPNSCCIISQTMIPRIDVQDFTFAQPAPSNSLPSTMLMHRQKRSHDAMHDLNSLCIRSHEQWQNVVPTSKLCCKQA